MAPINAHTALNAQSKKREIYAVLSFSVDGAESAVSAKRRESDKSVEPRARALSLAPIVARARWLGPAHARLCVSAARGADLTTGQVSVAVTVRFTRGFARMRTVPKSLGAALGAA
jgi:hypothetical protein